MGVVRAPLGVGDFPFLRAEAIVGRVVDRMILLFGGYPDLEHADLVQHGLMAAMRDWPTWNPRRSAASTFIYRCAKCDLMDLWRSRRRGKARDEKTARPSIDPGPDPDAFLSFDEPQGRPCYNADPDLPLAEWLRNVYALAIHRYPAKQIRRHRKFIKPEQAAAVCALMLRLDMGPKQVHFVMQEAPELREAVKMRHLPTLRWFQEVGGMIPLAKRRLRRITEHEQSETAGPRRAA